MLNIFANELPCNNFFITSINDDDFIKEFFYFETELEYNILKEIFKTYCSGPSPEAINQISNKIFLSDVANVNLLYAIHSTKFGYHLFGSDPSEILDVLVKEITLLSSIEKDYFGSSENITNIITNLAHGVKTFELSEFSEGFEEKNMSFGSMANIMYSRLEKFILGTVDNSFKQDDLLRIADTLFSARIAKSNNLNFYGSPLERTGAREVIIKIYLNNYEDGIIKYTEFNNLLSDNEDNNLLVNYIAMEPTINQVIDLNTINTSFNSKDFTQTGYLNESDRIFEEVLMKMLSNNFDANTDEVLTALGIRHVNNYANINCGLQEKSYKPNQKSSESLALELTFISYKLSCISSDELLYDLIYKLRNYYYFIDNENLSDEDYEDRLTTATITSMFIDNFVSQNNIINENSLNFFLSEYTLLKHTQLQSGYIKPVKSYEELMHILTFSQSFDLISTFIDINSSENLNTLISLKKIFYDQIIFDKDALKFNLLSRDVDKSSKIFISKGISLVSIGLLSDISYFSPEYLEVLVEDFRTGIDDTRYNQIQDILEITSFYLDNINDIFEPTSAEFIFSIKPLDDWLVFKDLLSFEIALKTVLARSGKIPYEQYFVDSDSRINQILSLRPERISLEKFKSTFIKENQNLSYIDLVIEYDNLQKDYRELLESKIILNKNVYDYAQSEIFTLEDSYKFDLLALQEKLFKEESHPMLFKHDSISSDHVQSNLNSDEAVLSFLSGEFFTVGILYTKTKKILLPRLISNGGFVDNSKKIIESFSNPNNSIPYYELKNMYESLFGGFDLSGIRDLSIVTDEVFSGFPFHALINPKNNKWLIDEYSISYLSSEKLLPYLDKKVISRRNNLLGFGNPALNKNSIENQITKFFSERGDFSIDDISELHELPESETEIKNISKHFRKSNLFFQDNATEINLLKSLDEPVDFIAFATHSVKGMNKFYDDRGLILTPVDSNNFKNDGFLSNQQIASLDLKNNPIVLLTACNTIESQYYLSLPYSGLTSSFMQAGADGVLLSLWNVNSKSSSILNQGIFKNSNGLQLRKALKKSVVNLKNTKEFSHPYYWAPYIYFGR